MESGPPSPDRPREDEPGSSGAPQTPPPGPDTPASPHAPAGPQAPLPAPQAPGSDASAPAPYATPGPGAPAGPQAPGGPESPPSYGGPVPPGGWEQPIARPYGGWAGQPLASWGSRVAATIVDWLILLIPTVILFIVVVASAVGISGDDDTSTGAAIVAVIFFWILVSLLWLLYAPLLMMREGPRNGQTIGRQLLGIRVVRNTGQPMSFGWAALREFVIKGLLVGIASSIIPVLPWLLDVLWPLWDDENRALHDMIVQTHVVKA